MKNRIANVTSGKVNKFYSMNSANKYNVKCAICGNTIPVGSGIRHIGYNGGFICIHCKPVTLGYHAGENTPTIGNSIKDEWIAGAENEIERGDLVRNREISECDALAKIASSLVHKFGYKMESDCTVWREFTGRTDNNLNGLSQVFMDIRKMHLDGLLTTEPENVGTHINLSNAWVRGFRWSSGRIDYELIAQKSIDVLKDHPYESKVVFGRDCGEWADAVAGTHRSAINTQHLTERLASETRFEFRIMKFHSGYNCGGNYYISGIQSWKKWIHTIEVCYNKGWSSERIADKCAKVLLKEMEKKTAAAEMANDGWVEWVTR